METLSWLEQGLDPWLDPLIIDQPRLLIDNGEDTFMEVGETYL